MGVNTFMCSFHSTVLGVTTWCFFSFFFSAIWTLAYSMINSTPSQAIFFVTPMKSVGTLWVTEGLRFYSKQHYTISGDSKMYFTSTTIIHVLLFFCPHCIPLNLLLFQVFTISLGCSHNPLFYCCTLPSNHSSELKFIFIGWNHLRNFYFLIENNFCFFV